MQTGAAARMDELAAPVAVDLRGLQPSATRKRSRSLKPPNKRQHGKILLLGGSLNQKPSGYPVYRGLTVYD